MNETLKKFSADLFKEFEAALQRKEVGALIEKTKADGGTTVRFVVSTADVDRQGDSLDQKKWDFEKFNMNPVILWAHDYKSLPIGRGANIVTEKDGKTYCDITFTPEDVNPFGAQVGRLAQAGFVNTTSVGYMEKDGGTLELLEISCVPVPANPYALAQRTVKDLRLDLSALVMKGLEFSIKKEAAGDTCTTDDGEAGTLEEKDGALVCVPSEKENKNMNEKLQKALEDEHARHASAVTASIDALAAPAEEGKSKKTVEDFEKEVDEEHGTHAASVMKAIDENWELDEQKADESQAEADALKTAMGDECKIHVENMDAVIEEYKATADETAVETLKGKATEELSRHLAAHIASLEGENAEEDEDEETEEEKAAKEAEAKAKGTVADKLAENTEREAKWKRLRHCWSIFWAFEAAYTDEEVGVDQFDGLLDEAISLMKAYQEEGPAAVGAEDEKGAVAKALESGASEKAGRRLSQKTKQALENIMTTLAGHDEEHGKSTTVTIAALKELIGSEEGSVGEEQPTPEEKSSRKVAPNQRPRSAKTATSLDEFNSFLLAREVLRTVKAASDEGLAKIKSVLREKYPDRRS